MVIHQFLEDCVCVCFIKDLITDSNPDEMDFETTNFNSVKACEKLKVTMNKTQGSQSNCTKFTLNERYPDENKEITYVLKKPIEETAKSKEAIFFLFVLYLYGRTIRLCLLM
ncbi:hypothetical protein TNIN_342491 [Trichonephila inaurata madagascariensis]|uniref:Uncharacterized protein n=1 Tax=Trichonephila inaurata madagascariensis TaxID=2747483 RepID=A0A8X7BPI0_9ARAC|nr:hypothetical protein TNIN_342491 [Trichonephila inaurata madagascariensis]